MTQEPTEWQGKEKARKHILQWRCPELKARETDFGGKCSVSFLSILSKLVCDVQLLFNLHLHNYHRIIKNTVLRINHFSRYCSLLSMVSLSVVLVTCGQPWPTMVQKYEMENSINKQLINFKLWAVLSSVMKSCAVPLHSAEDVNHPVSSTSMLSTLPVC